MISSPPTVLFRLNLPYPTCRPRGRRVRPAGAGDHWGEAGLHEQRAILVKDLSGYLPDADHGAALALKELVTRRAAGAGKGNPPIPRIDVLHALKVEPDRLHPAPCAITAPEGLIPRAQEAEVAARIIEAQSRPVVLHADGCIGKSIMAARIRHGMPAGSHTVLYDCFGNGDYRQPIRARHSGNCSDIGYALRNSIDTVAHGRRVEGCHRHEAAIAAQFSSRSNTPVNRSKFRREVVTPWGHSTSRLNAGRKFATLDLLLSARNLSVQ